MGILYEDKITKISEGEAAYALRENWKKIYGEYPSLDALALLWAQWALETGRGKAIHCYNFGNIKRSGTEDYCMFRCNEMIKGKLVWFDPPHKQTWFRAYSSSLDGAFDYLTFLSKRTRYQKAWEALKKGDVYSFSHELKLAGYYTANEEQYTRGLASLAKEFKNKSTTILQWQPVPDKEVITPKEFPAEVPVVEESEPEKIVVVEPVSVKKTWIQKLLEIFFPSTDNCKSVEKP